MQVKENTGTAVKVVQSAQEKRWKKIAYLSLFSLALLFIAYAIYSYVSYDSVVQIGREVSSDLDEKFVLMLFAGFFAQLVDGALGMGYGVVSTSSLLSGGLNPAVISGIIHTA